VFAGADGKELTEFSRKQFTELKKYYFVDSIRILESLQKAGVEIHIISASADMIVRGAAESLGIPPENIHGVQLEIRNGTLTDKIIDPYPYGDGKVLVMRKIEKERNGKALYGFGNSYSSDGAFLLEIVKQGGKSMMINGGNAHPGMSEHFRCVNSTRMLGELPEMKQ